ncbi:MAG TPA: DUF3365 domain-containing protein [Dokdonella sp.]|uniref:c-type heme family protein n=1 Tax=Dokdonella sp. TaxID=2291710 RepID=UPI002D805917|nr:DUF3365 domain-containing protein [Dokdonella sp.]HET9031781.1 DUF3365 domain-containing protein [Dokdonella sp.]
MKTIFCFIIALFGCAATNAIASSSEQTEPAPRAVEWTQLQALGDNHQSQRRIADKARTELATRLMKRLGDSIAVGGPAAGIEVCSNEAAGIAATVAEANNVRIGRTSHKLRNPDNGGPAWIAQVVSDRSTTTRYFSRPDGALAVATPIPLGQMCSQCHGPVADIVPEIKKALVSRYPQDMATGFEVGEIRGWFWVEVPAQANTDS